MKILDAMQDDPDRHRLAFKEAWDRAVNRFCMEFMLNFMSADGSINWRELLQYNSGATAVPWKTFPFDAAPESSDAACASPSACKESETPFRLMLLPSLRMPRARLHPLAKNRKRRISPSACRL